MCIKTKMKNKYQEKVNKEIIEVINPIRNNWNNFTDKELETLFKKFGNICRNETSLFRESALSDNELGNVLLEIGNKYNNNAKILVEIVSSIYNMKDRYGLEITDSIFQFLITQTKNKKVNFYVSLFITELSQFANYDQKWDYIMSIHSIAPKQKSINTFYHVITDNINNIPINCKIDAIKIFEKILNNSNFPESIVNKYLELIAKLGIDISKK